VHGFLPLTAYGKASVALGAAAFQNRPLRPPLGVILTYRHTEDMLRHMRTTVRLEEALLERARAEAARRKTTLTSLIEQGLELVLRRPMKRLERKPVDLPECGAGGGVLPGVDLNDSASLLDRMEGRD
jgi:hypothetical protein